MLDEGNYACRRKPTRSIQRAGVGTPAEIWESQIVDRREVSQWASKFEGFDTYLQVQQIDRMSELRDQNVNKQKLLFAISIMGMVIIYSIWRKIARRDILNLKKYEE